ncbi:UNVERIFIED_CONTAM: hypothetical protein FKN15_000221 [Acipenser sinensis]
MTFLQSREIANILAYKLWPVHDPLRWDRDHWSEPHWPLETWRQESSTEIPSAEVSQSTGKNRASFLPQSCPGSQGEAKRKGQICFYIFDVIFDFLFQTLCSFNLSASGTGEMAIFQLFLF